MPNLLSRLSRKTSTGRFIPEIDGLRFIAISMVLLTHLRLIWDENIAPLSRGAWLEMGLAQGKYGVHLFFVISAFILGLPFAAHYLAGGKPVNLRSYYLRRLTRLEPPYILVLTVIFFSRLLIQTERGGLAENFPHYLASLFYAHNIIYHGQSTVLSPAWSLEIEIQFYVLVPVLTMLFRISNPLRRRLVIAGCALAVIFLQRLLPAVFWKLTIAGYLQFFLMGFLMADVYLVSWKSSPPAQSFVWDIIALMLISTIFAAPFFPHLEVWWYRLLSYTIFLFYFAAFKGTLTRKFISNPCIATIGGMCYTIYLIHSPLMTAVAKTYKRFLLHFPAAYNGLLFAAICVSVVLGVSTALFMLIERPCMEKDWPRRAWAWLGSVFNRGSSPGSPLN